MTDHSEIHVLSNSTFLFLVLTTFIQFILGDDVLLDQVSNAPNLTLPPLRRPVSGTLVGPIDQYNRLRYLDMTALATNLRLTKRELEDKNKTWNRDGIPLAWKVSIQIHVFDKLTYG